MKNIIAAGAVLLLAGGAQALHAETNHDWAISGYIGIADFESEEKPDPYRPEVTHELTSDTAFKAGVIASKYYNDFSFNLGIESMQEVEVHDELDNKIGEHSHVPVFLGVNYHFDTNVIDPYIGAGFGYSFNDASESDFITGQGMSMEVDDSTFYFLTAGVEYPFSKSYTVFLAGKYTIGDIDVKGSSQTPQGTMQIEDEGTLDRYEVNLGLKYFF
ncbi:MAG: hypothetical protein D3924_12475 [Candidatus Electrothrix sp. AR4]|nr:hypothetical protein [Candidatus Electrothrix sp. AR4]